MKKWPHGEGKEAWQACFLSLMFFSPFEDSHVEMFCVVFVEDYLSLQVMCVCICICICSEGVWWQVWELVKARLLTFSLVLTPVETAGLNLEQIIITIINKQINK